MNGIMDDVRVYNRVLTVAEVKALAGGHPLSATGTQTLQDTLDVDGSVYLGDGTLVTGANAITVGGSWEDSAATFTSTGSTVTFNGASGTKTIAETNAFGNLIFNDAGGTATFRPLTAIDANGAFTLTDGVFDMDTYDKDLTVGGDFAISGGTFTRGAGTVHFDGNTTNVGAGGQDMGNVGFE